MNRVIFILIVTALLNGCASNSSPPKPQAVSNIPIYGLLEELNGSWEITQLSAFQIASERGIVINLANKIPTTNTNTIGCTSWLWSADYDYKSKPCIKAPFRDTEMNRFTVPTYFLVGFMSFGIGLFTGAASIDSYFDWEAYQEALTPALARKNLSDDKLRKISAELNKLQSLSKERLLLCEQIKLNQGSYERHYNDQYLGDIHGMIQIIDQSGFAAAYPHLDGKNQVSIKPHVTDYKNYVAHCNKHQSPFKSKQYSAVMAELKQLQQAEQQSLSATRTSHAKYEQALKAGGYFEISCAGKSGAQEGNFNYRSYCPESLNFNGKQLNKQGKLKFVLESRDFSDVMPSAYLSSDKNIEITLEGDSITVANGTSNYISIDKLSLYYQGKILTISQNGGVLKDLPPKSYDTFKLNDFDLEKLNTDFKNLTLKDAQTTKVKFGISAKYSITNSNVKHSLHQLKQYNLASIL